MTGQIRGLKCYSGGRNTGKAGCPLVPGFIGVDILVPWDFTCPALPVDSDETIASAMVALLLAGLHVDNYADRFQFIGKYVSFEDKSEKPTMQTKGYGKKKKINRGVIVHEYTHDEGADYHNILLTFDQKQNQYKVIRIDKQGVVYGANQHDPVTNAIVGIQGIELDSLDVYDREDANYTTDPVYRIGYTFANSAELNEDGFAVATGVNIIALLEDAGVIDVALTGFASTGTRTFPFMAKTANGSINLGDTFRATLADTTAWVFNNKVTGAAITNTSVTYSSVTKKYTIVFATGGGYSATAVAVGRLAAVSVLDGLDISFYESDVVEITMV